MRRARTRQRPGPPFAVAAHIAERLAAADSMCRKHERRGFDRGTFAPPMVYPQAEVPGVPLSIKSSDEPAENVLDGQRDR